MKEDIEEIITKYAMRVTDDGIMIFPDGLDSILKDIELYIINSTG